ncbi:hypothetical protein H4219_004722 [Mycoemilia scoparia]|uniref:Chitin-binding type-2 domain-containing protein n=1 Tax=Mycoemilia scoparia TaxID=417184 RepID=A0A9W7ZQP7_9FUNG|nr:hypothetical protein H4219_004722 [Mycoemilia scoparia]
MVKPLFLIFTTVSLLALNSPYVSAASVNPQPQCQAFQVYSQCPGNVNDVADHYFVCMNGVHTKINCQPNNKCYLNDKKSPRCHPITPKNTQNIKPRSEKMKPDDIQDVKDLKANDADPIKHKISDHNNGEAAVTHKNKVHKHNGSSNHKAKAQNRKAHDKKVKDKGLGGLLDNFTNNLVKRRKHYRHKKGSHNH